MSKRKTLSRREFLRFSALATGAAALAACTPAPPASPTSAPAPAQPAAAPTSAAGAPPAPTAAAPAKPAEKIGANLVGKLEGPEIITDVSKFPKSFKEAPMLADLVKAGKLPPVEQRLPAPEDLMVIKPLREIGKYGGTWRRGFTGPGDVENGNRIVSSDKPIFFDFTGTKHVPSVAKAFKMSDDGKSFTLTLRKGMKWSDGQPFNADDFVFWFEDIYSNKDLVPTPVPDMSINGKPGKLVKVDDVTVRFEFPEPNWMFQDVMAGSTLPGGGQATQNTRASFQGCYDPAHYLKQFLPKYTPQADLDAKAKAAGFDGWKSMLMSRMRWDQNPDLPVLTPWKTVSPITTPNWVWERNPYYWEVDTEGNQLPYLDKVQLTLGENLEVINLRAIAGEYDIQERHTDLGKMPVFLENRQKGNYTVHLDPALNGADTALHINQGYDADPEIASWLQNKDFRHALALGIDRDQLNETFWLGVGVPGSVAPAPDSIFSPGAEYNKKWAVLDVKQANDLLDKIGLDKKDGDGYRLRKDGKGRLRIEMITVGGQFVPYTQIAEMIRQQWIKIGIQADVKELERTLAFRRDDSNENQILLWANDGSEWLYLFPRHALPVDPSECHMGMAIAKWYASNGAQGKAPQGEELKKALELFRAAPGLKRDDQIAQGKEIWKLIVEGCWSIGTVGQSPAVMGVRILSNKIGNSPDRQINAQHCRTPGTSHPETFYFK
ncbi:MAG TPA: ABC transporter substrate-binding protein [Chloroflexota bacterium]